VRFQSKLSNHGFNLVSAHVWRNKSVDPRGSDTNSGQTNYDDLFADPVWMENCWIDYLLPLYWSIDHKTASYAKLIKWWSENSTNTAIYIGKVIKSIPIQIKNGIFKRNSNQIDLTYKKHRRKCFFVPNRLLIETKR
jgi:uncharacterized lipoprotein YddW (UPF0748 family)